MSQKEDIKKVWKKVQADELGDVTFFESGDEFFILETTAFGGESTLSPDVYVPFTPSKDGKQYRKDEEQEDEGGHDDVEDDGTIDDEDAEEKIKHKRRKREGDEDEDDGEDGDEEDGDDDGDDEDEDGDDEEDDNRKKKKKKKKKDDDDTDDDDSDTDDDSDWEDDKSKKKKKRKKKTKIKVGTKIRVKATGEERIVTQVSDDGTSYVTAPVQSDTPATPKKRGGSNISDVADINEFADGGQTRFADSWKLTQDEYNKENINVHSNDNRKRKEPELVNYFQKNITNRQHAIIVDRAITEGKFEMAIKDGIMTRERANQIIASAEPLLSNPIRYADGGETIKLKDIKVFTNQNELPELETTAFEGEMSSDPAWIPTGVKVPKVEGGDDENGGDEEIEGGDNIIHTPPKPEIRVGTKVRIKNTGQEGVVTQVNDDGTYVVTPIYENGGQMGMELHCPACEVEQIEPNLASKFESIEEPIDFDGNPSTDDDTYTRDEIEVVREDDDDEDEDDDDDDDDDNDNPPPPPRPINRDLYLGKLNRIKQYVFKTPTFAKVFFNAKLQEENDFWGGQAHMVLYNRVAKDYLRIKKSIKLQSADYLLSMTNNMFPVFDIFCQANMIDIQGAYYINPSKAIENLFAFTDRGTIRQGNEQEAQIRLAFSQICSIDWMLTVLNNEEEVNDEFSYIIKEAVKRIEKFIVLDQDLYAILSLSAFYKPELFSKNYLTIHLNFIFSYYGELNLGFSNFNNGCFTDISLGVMSRDDRPTVNIEEIIRKTEQLGTNVNMNVYTLIREKAIGDYQVYKSENIRCNDEEKPVVSKKYFLKDIDAENKSVIKENIIDFYKFCLLLKDNNKNKKVTLDNMKILSILQKESYKDFMMRIQLLITTDRNYYGL
jgi:hypothetical protein